jgi:hypothetical protein
MDTKSCSPYTTIQVIAKRCKHLTDVAMVINIQEIMLISIKLEGCHTAIIFQHREKSKSQLHLIGRGKDHFVPSRNEFAPEILRIY